MKDFIMCVASGIIGGAVALALFAFIRIRIDITHGEPPKVPAPTHGDN